MFESAARKLARLCGPKPLHLAQRGQQGRDDRAPAVEMEFGDILAGGTVGTLESKHQGIVDQLVLPAYLRQRSRSRLRKPAGQGFDRLIGTGAADPHQSDRRRWLAGGKSEDGIVQLFDFPLI